MKNILNKIWKFIKLFPLTSYSIFIICFVAIVHFTSSQDNNLVYSLVIFLSYPFLLLGKVLTNYIPSEVLNKFYYPALFGIFIVFLLDLIIIQLRFGIFPKINSVWHNRRTNRHDPR